MHRELGEKLRELLKLEREPVTIKWSVREPRDIKKEEGKSRFCKKSLKKPGKGKHSTQPWTRRNVKEVFGTLE